MAKKKEPATLDCQSCRRPTSVAWCISCAPGDMVASQVQGWLDREKALGRLGREAVTLIERLIEDVR